MDTDGRRQEISNKEASARIAALILVVTVVGLISLVCSFVRWCNG